MIDNKTILNTSLFTNLSSGAVDNIMPNEYGIIIIPHIGENGNWWIGDYDTGVSAQGPQGPQGIDGPIGPQGLDGQNGITPILGIDTSGYWTIDRGDGSGVVRLQDVNGHDVKAVGTDGQDGVDGQDGNDGADGKDGITPKLIIMNNHWYISYDTEWTQLGKATGENGSDGKDGQDGVTPQFKIENNYWYISYDNGLLWSQLDRSIGDTGQEGPQGPTGITPHIGVNGNWFIDTIDTGINATGPIGPKGDPGIVDTSNFYTKDQIDTKVNVINSDIEQLSTLIGNVNVLLETRIRGGN